MTSRDVRNLCIYVKKFMYLLEPKKGSSRYINLFTQIHKFLELFSATEIYEHFSFSIKFKMAPMNVLPDDQI
jgi:hypothetical protein